MNIINFEGNIIIASEVSAITSIRDVGRAVHFNIILKGGGSISIQEIVPVGESPNDIKSKLKKRRTVFLELWNNSIQHETDYCPCGNPLTKDTEGNIIGCSRCGTD